MSAPLLLAGAAQQLASAPLSHPEVTRVWLHGPGPGFGGWGFLFLLIPLFWIGLIALIISLAARRRRKFWAANGGVPGRGFGPGAGFAAYPGWGWQPGGQGAGQNGWPASPPSSTADAEKTLSERFARGDIDEVDYRARLEVLRANHPTPPAPPTPAA